MPSLNTICGAASGISILGRGGGAGAGLSRLKEALGNSSASSTTTDSVTTVGSGLVTSRLLFFLRRFLLFLSGASCGRVTTAVSGSAGIDGSLVIEVGVMVALG